MAKNIKCVNSNKIIEHNVQKLMINNAEILYCQKCEFVDSSNPGCIHCYGQIAQLKNKKQFRNYYIYQGDGEIKEFFDADKILTSSKGQSNITTWAYTERPDTYKTDCIKCKSKAVKSNSFTLCEEGKRCTNQTQRVFYI